MREPDGWRTSRTGTGGDGSCAFRRMTRRSAHSRIRVAVEQPLGRDAAADAQAILSALRAGRVYSAIDALATPPALEFTLKDSLVRRAHERTWRRNDRAAQRRTDRFAAIRARVDVRLERGAGKLSCRGPPVERTWRSACSVDREQPDLRASRWVGSGTSGGRSSAADDFAEHSGWPVAHGNRRHDSTAQVSQTQPPNGPAVFSYRLGDGDRAEQYAALVIGVGTALTERTSSRRSRASFAPDARLGSGTPAAIGRAVAEVDLSRRRGPGHHRSVQSTCRPSARAAPSIPAGQTR